jgi:hypothetical protein
MIPRRQVAARLILVCGNGQDHRPLIYFIVDANGAKAEGEAKSAALELDRKSNCGNHTWRRIVIR